MAKLRGIAYVSTAVIPFSTEQLEWLINECKVRNLASAVTGVLLYHEGSFMQYFEGPVESMPGTYGRILASSRHRDIIELLDMPVVERSFGSWEMGLGRPTKSELLAISTERWKRRAGEPATVGETSPGLELLKGFWKGTRN